MRHPVLITIATLLIAALVYGTVYAVFGDARAAFALLVIAALVSFILMSAFDSSELHRIS